MEHRVNARCTCCMSFLCTCYTKTCNHTQLDQKPWLGNDGKGHASINRCLALHFWRVFLSLPLKSVGFCLLLFLRVWHANALPFWQLLFITSIGVRGPGASGTWVEGLTSLEWLCTLNVHPLGLWLHRVSSLFGGSLWCSDSNFFCLFFPSRAVDGSQAIKNELVSS